MPDLAVWSKQRNWLIYLTCQPVLRQHARIWTVSHLRTRPIETRADNLDVPELDTYANAHCFDATKTTARETWIKAQILPTVFQFLLRFLIRSAAFSATAYIVACK